MKNNRLPQGIKEYTTEEAVKREELTQKLFTVLKKEGYMRAEPAFVDFAKNLEMERNSSDTLFRSFDSDGKLLAFAGDITPSIIRYIEGDILPKRVYFDRMAYSFMPNARSARVADMCGAQVYGITGAEGDAEIIAAAYDSLVFAGIKDVKITISHGFFIKSVIYSYKPTEDITAEDIKVLVETGRCDKLNEVCVAAVNALAKQKGDIKIMKEAAEGINNKEAIDCLLRLFEIHRILAEYGLADAVEFDFGYMSDTSYYNGMIFKLTKDGSVLAEGGHFTGIKNSGNATGCAFKYELNNIIKVLEAIVPADDKKILMGISSGDEALAKARKIKISLMESDVRVDTVYNVTKAECKNAAVLRNIENYIYINDKGEIEE